MIPDVEAVKLLARTHQSMIWDRTRQVLRLRSALREFFPAALQAFDDLTAADTLELLGRAPDPDRAARLSSSHLAAAFRSASWRAALAVVLDRAAGDLSRLRRLGLVRFTVAVRRELPRWGATRPCLRIVRAVFDALADPAGVAVHRLGALERAELVLGDWRDTRRRLADVETRMVAVLDELDLTGLVTSIDGLTAVGAAAILAETGDPVRFHSPRAVVKHAGLCMLPV